MNIRYQNFNSIKFCEINFEREKKEIRFVQNQNQKVGWGQIGTKLTLRTNSEIDEKMIGSCNKIELIYSLVLVSVSFQGRQNIKFVFLFRSNIKITVIVYKNLEQFVNNAILNF